MNSKKEKDTGLCLSRREGVVLRHLAGEHLLVPTSSKTVNLDHLFLLNATGVFVWECLDGSLCAEALTAAVAKEFEVTAEVAAADVHAFLGSLLEHQLAEEAGKRDC